MFAVVEYLHNKLPPDWDIHFYGGVTPEGDDLTNYVLFYRRLPDHRTFCVPVVFGTEPLEDVQTALHAVWGNHEMGYDDPSLRTS